MYIAHDCKVCTRGHVILGTNHTGSPEFKCNNCNTVEDQATFWEGMRSEAYLRELEAEIEEHFPNKDIESLKSTIDIAVGYHVLGDLQRRDFCIKAAIEEAKSLKDKWQICYCDFSRIERKIISFEETAKRYPQDSEKYLNNLASIRETFKNLPEILKTL